MADATAQVERVVRAVVDPARVRRHLSRTAAATLSHGLPGTALLLACLSTGDPALAPAAEQHWNEAARLLAGRPPDGIHSGPGALAASLVVGCAHTARTHGGRHSVPDALDDAVGWLSARAQGLARHQQQRWAAGLAGCPWGVYDVIKGLSGIGRMLLAAPHRARGAAAPGLTAALTTLTGVISNPAGDLPGWWLPAEDHRLPLAGELPASGAATTGMAHGVAGPLALLSLAARAGHTVPGQREAIRTAATWLLRWSDSDARWPAHVSGDALRSAPDARSLTAAPGRRDAWCYGAAGIGSAVAHAGRALHDVELVNAGRAAVAGIARRAAHEWDTGGPGLCHGSAGVLQAAQRMGCPELRDSAAEATATRCEGEELSASAGHVGYLGHLGHLGFLDGATGAALALADAEGLLPEPDAVTWDALLLLN